MKGLTKCSHHLIPSFFLLIFNILLFYLGHVSMTKWPINCLWTLDSKKQKNKKKICLWTPPCTIWKMLQPLQILLYNFYKLM